MTIYDAHMHIGGSANPNPEQLVERLNACGITGGNVMSIDPDDVNFTYKERMDNLFAWTKGFEDRIFPVAWLHPYETDILDKVKDCVERGVVAFKFIPNNYHVYDPKATEVFRLIEELGYPVMFHSGVLYDFMKSSKYNRPMDWENFVDYKNLRFSLAHCAHPWYDEAMLICGKFRWINWHMNEIAQGNPDIYTNNPWVQSHLKDTDQGKTYDAPQLYLDTTPGAHGVYRKDLLQKCFSSQKDGRNIFFGTDKYVEDYPVEVVKGWLKEEREALAEVNATDEFLENMYCNSMFRFLNIERRV